MTLINPQIDGLVRHILTAGAGFLVGSGYIPASSVEGVVTAVLTLATVIWSIVAKKQPA